MLQRYDLQFNSEMDSEFSSESDGSHEEQIRTALTPASQDATPQELRKVILIILLLAICTSDSETLLLNMRGRLRETMK